MSSQTKPGLDFSEAMQEHLWNYWIKPFPLSGQQALWWHGKMFSWSLPTSTIPFVGMHEVAIFTQATEAPGEIGTALAAASIEVFTFIYVYKEKGIKLSADRKASTGQLQILFNSRSVIVLLRTSMPWNWRLYLPHSSLLSILLYRHRCTWLVHRCNPYIHLYGMAGGCTGLKFLWDGKHKDPCYLGLFLLKNHFSLSSFPTAHEIGKVDI